MNEKSKTLIYIMIIIWIIALVSFGYLMFTEEQNALCKDYADQELTATRIGYTENSQKEYSINGVWVKEQQLYENCLQKQ